MQEFDFSIIEEEARKKWSEKDVYKVNIDTSKPKYYVLDMFPYPSGAGLHVGHPLGYIASDIYSRYKRLKGFNVLHPMGFDAFGLPAEQYAIQTGQHPAKTTLDNIATYKKQLGKIGFSYDWSREVVTSEPAYYRWTQWIFIQLFNSWYDKSVEKAKSISDLTAIFEQSGNVGVQAACDEKTPQFTAEDWKAFTEKSQQEILMHYRLAYQSYALVNWCPELGTVLANDEIVNGVSERGGYPVERKKMSQWFLRITAYAERLLQGLNTLEWSDSMKEMQRNWIGKSIGAMVSFPIENHDADIEVFTTRVDTIFGVSFIVIAPEHELVQKITTSEYEEAVLKYKKTCAAKSDIERQQEKAVSGQFTGAHVIHPISGVKVPVFIADYVLAGYGTGAVMAVPSGDQRDYLFAKKFDLPIIQILDAQDEILEEANPTKEGRYVNSDIINGMAYQEAISTVTQALEKIGKGYAKVNFRMRDAGFSRQRYWGEPFPVYYDKDGIVRVLSESDLPVTLPAVENFKPTSDGKSPLANAPEWVNELGEGQTRETDTMPAFAGSSWYFLRYMDPKNENEFVSQEAQEYWQDVDLYIGGTEHAVGHLLYSRFWHKFFKDNNWVSTEEPFKKLVNQGMIQGRSLLTKADSIKGMPAGMHIPLSLTGPGDKIYKEKLIELTKADNRFAHIQPDTDVNWEDIDGKPFISLQFEVEKMSKSKFNVVNPDDMIDQFGADTFRMFEMFLGPIEAHKPWDTNGIEGVSKFVRKIWRLYGFDEAGQATFKDEASKDELKVLHRAIKKVTDDIERFSFNTAVSAMMIAVNDLGKLTPLSKTTLETIPVLIAPLAPFIAEALWTRMGNEESVFDAQFPMFDSKNLVEESILYPISINGKVRAKLEIAASLSPKETEEVVLNDEGVQKWLDGKAPKKVIVVPGRIVNIVL
ncbi:MAG TPA: leucine--tRNA ligase [Chitinophagales bacterium]|nr:leucine--tRNA ligase [Chitinophagales bacterium]